MDLTNSPVETGAPLAVRRVETERGSHIEPPLDESWPDFVKLRWWAGVVFADSGLRVDVTRWSSPGQYSLTGKTPVRSWSRGAGSFDQAWLMLTNIGMGAQLARDHEANKES